MIQSHVLTILIYCFDDLFDISDYNNLNILHCEKGQYIGYQGTKTTDTYIKLDLEWENIEITIEVGKAMSETKKQIYYIDNGIEYDISIINKDSEYKYLIQDAFNGDKSKYLNSFNIINFWKLSDYILNQIEKVKMNYYSIPKLNKKIDDLLSIKKI